MHIKLKHIFSAKTQTRISCLPKSEKKLQLKSSAFNQIASRWTRGEVGLCCEGLRWKGLRQSGCFEMYLLDLLSRP